MAQYTSEKVKTGLKLASWYAWCGHAKFPAVFQTVIEMLEQDGRLEKVARDLAACGAAVQRLLQRTGDDLPHEKPPHY